MILAQISDLHLGPQFVADAFNSAIEEILSLDPDLVVASGDFTENGLLREYTLANKEMKKLSFR